MGLKSRVQAFSRYSEAIPVLDWLFAQLENAINGQLDSTNLATGGVIGANIATATITSDKLVDGIGLCQSLQYTGNGAAARSIALTFQPRYVVILSHTDSITFEALGSGSGPYAAFWRTAAGALTSGTTDFQGISGSAVLLGSALANLSNKNAQTYSLIAIR